MADSTIHIVMLPWSAFGHLIPFFKLSIALAKAGVRVSFVSTPKNIQRLPKVPSTLAHLVDLVQFPLPSLDKELLPEGAEATIDIPFEKIQYLKLAYDQLQHAVKKLLIHQLPNWIICDFSPHWMADIAHEFQVKLIFYSVFSASSMTFFGPSARKAPLSPESLTVPPEWVTFPSSVAYQRHEAISFCAGANPVNASGVSDFERITKVLGASKAVLFRSCYEIEGEYLNAFQKLVGKPVIPIGLLPVDRAERGIVDECSGNIFEWLDKQASKSVVFVGFGSECKLTKDQVFEIAYGLEESELPFLWALRKPSWASNDEDSVPVGFNERTCNRGIVCMGWIPQQEILAHPSIGGSLFHSGWGSAIEALQFGHSLVLLPFIIDQPLNARFLVEKGLAIEVKRNEDGSFTRNDIATSLRQAMVLEEGKNIRINTREAATIVGNLKLHQDHYMVAFVQFLKMGTWKQICMMIPWSAFGHLIPFFKLSIALAKAGVHVSFVSTPKNIQRLPKVPSTLAHLVDLVQFPLSSLDKELLPEGAEATVDIPFEKIQYLKLAYDQLQHAVKKLLINQLPNWIICDFSPHWMADIAQEFQVKLLFYNVLSAPAMTFLGVGNRKTPISPESLTVPPEWVTFPSSVAYQRHEAITFCAGANPVNASGVSDFERVTKILGASKAVLVRSCYEIEGEYLNAFQKLVGKPVIPIGLLPVDRAERGIVDECNGNIFEWLDKQASKSVVFVGFGSELKLTKDQVFEIAYGLEESELPFLWALRKPSWANNDEDSVPVGFNERTCNRGIVCMGWIPQQEILAHPSIGGSLFHSGWGSVIETLQFVHSLVVLPFIIDQPLNARFLVEKGLAIEVKKNEDGSFTRNDIATSLRQAMVLEEGKNIRINAGEAATIVGNLKLHQDHYIAAFVQFLQNGIWKQT
ncbi:putative UDP-rhamnose:rhamnosyltransferase 1, partial [Mucuna pruriens]